MNNVAIQSRMKMAVRAAIFHLICSFAVAALAATFVFGFWYPFPYREMAGGRSLFLLIVSVDIICGPLLTLVMFSPNKQRQELWRDLALVATIQIGALGYGVWTMWQARPLYLVQEVDRFKVVMNVDLDQDALNALPTELRSGLLRGPVTVAIREPKTSEERNKVLLASIEGGRDYAERPEFYLPYKGDAALRALNRAKALPIFLDKYPEQVEEAKAIANHAGKNINQLMYLPVTSRQDWIAILDDKAMIIGFLKGDGF